MAETLLRTFRPSAADPWDRAKVAHLLGRAGFGGTPDDIARLAGMRFEDAVEELLEYERISDEPFPEIDFSEVREMAQALADLRRGGAAEREVREASQQFRRANVQKFQEIRAGWVQRMLQTRRPLQEKMVLFWHGHLVSGFPDVTSAEHMAMQLALFRQMPTGSFKELILAISQDPAMLSYLDNNSNRKGKPNENYARELMELFTLGVGNFGEQDVKEAARAFTGWTFAANEFVFRRNQHDDGMKTFLGRTGTFDGTDVIEILFAQPAAARHLPRKLFEFFAYQGPEEPVIDELAGIFRRSDWSVRAVLRVLFHSALFYSPKTVRAQVKSPVELVVGAVRALGVEVPPQALLRALDLMGQSLLYPPNVGGWPKGKGWINTATILIRYNFSELLLDGTMPGAGSGRSMTGGAPGRVGTRARPIPLEQLIDAGPVRTVGDVITQLLDRFIQTPLEPRRRWALLRPFGTNREDAPITIGSAQFPDQLRATVHLIMSMPEYQLT